MTMEAAGTSGTFTVPADHPCLAGHFPGDPIVPAVLLLELSSAVLRQLRPELGPLREVRTVKFMQPVRPGEPVEVAFSPGGVPGSLRFSCTTAAGMAVQGQLLFGAAP